MGPKRPGNAGQKRAAKTKARAQRLRSGSPTAPAAERTLKNVLAEYHEWLRGTDLAAEADTVLRLVETALTQLARAVPEFAPTSWRPDDAHELLDLADAIAEKNEEAAFKIVLSALSFLTFLDDVDLWTGSDGDFGHCMDDLSDFLDGTEDMLEPEDIELPDVTDEDEKAALAALPLMTSIDALLDWVGTGRDLTPTSLRDLASVVGGDSGAEDSVTDTEESAYDAPHVVELLVAAQTGLITIDDGEATASTTARNARDLDQLRAMVTAYVAAQLTPAPDEEEMLFIVHTLAAQSLLAAMLPEPPESPLDDSYESLEPDDRQVALLSSDRLRSFARQGWLVATETLSVPEPLRRAVLAGIAAAFPLADDEASI